MVRQLVSKVQYINLIGALSHVAEEAFDRIGRLDMSVHASRELVKRQQVRLILNQTADRFWIALSILGGSRLPDELMPPTLSVAPRCPRVQLAHHRALVVGWHEARCAAYVPDSEDSAWPKTAPRPQPTAHHARH